MEVEEDDEDDGDSERGDPIDQTRVPGRGLLERVLEGTGDGKIAGMGKPRFLSRVSDRFSGFSLLTVTGHNRESSDGESSTY